MNKRQVKCALLFHLNLFFCFTSLLVGWFVLCSLSLHSRAHFLPLVMKRKEWTQNKPTTPVTQRPTTGEWRDEWKTKRKTTRFLVFFLCVSFSLHSLLTPLFPLSLLSLQFNCNEKKCKRELNWAKGKGKERKERMKRDQRAKEKRGAHSFHFTCPLLTLGSLFCFHSLEFLVHRLRNVSGSCVLFVPLFSLVRL